MAMHGTVAANPHEGSRSEYIAQYIFSSVGTSTLVPHQEDSGIDLHCTLGNRIGKRFHVDNYFIAQIKSTSEPLLYETLSIKWLLSHKYPIIFVIINKKKNMIAIYQTMELLRLFYHDGLERIELRFSANNTPFNFAKENNRNKVLLNLGKPIIKTSFSAIAHSRILAQIKSVLEYWVTLHQGNLDLKNMGLTLFKVPNQVYKTNQLPDSKYKYCGSVQVLDSHKPLFLNTQENMWRLLHQFSFILAQMANKSQYQALGNGIANVIKMANEVLGDDLGKSFALRHFLLFLNAAAKHNNLPPFFNLQAPDGQPLPDELRIIEKSPHRTNDGNQL